MTTLCAGSLDLTETIFSKTSAGWQEIQNRTMGLPALIRRVLVMVDGKRSGKELAAFVGGQENISEVLGQLVAHGCIDAQEGAKPAAATPAAAPVQPDDALHMACLPHAALRTPKEVDMARNFMVNTTNSIFGQNMRLSLIKSILKCQGAEELRQVYPAWESNMASSGAGTKALPELREKLLRVL